MVKRIVMFALVASASGPVLCLAQSLELDRRIDALRIAHRTPGLAVSVVKDGRVLWTKGYGMADPTAAQPAAGDSVLSLASLTKPITATGIMLLIEDGKVAIDDPIAKFIPEAPQRWGNITVEHLLTHTSGLADFINDRVTPQDHDIRPREIVAQIAESQLLFPAGQRRRYSNSNFLILGEIITAVTGQSWDVCLRNRIFHPVGMPSTALRDAQNQVGFMYSDQAKAFVPAWPLRASVFDNADGGLVSSVNDLARFEIALRSGRVLKLETLALMVGEQDGKALGWERNDVRGHVRIEHGGLRSGAAAQYSYFVDDGVTIIVLGNSVELPAMEIVEEIASSMNPAYTPPNLMTPVGTVDARIDQQVRAWIEAVASGNASSPALAAGTAAMFIPDLSSAMKRMNRDGSALQQLWVDRLPKSSRRHGNDAVAVAYYRVAHGSDLYYPIFFLDSLGAVVDYDAVRYGGDSGIPVVIWIGAGAVAAMGVAFGAVVVCRHRRWKRLIALHGRFGASN